MYERSLPFAAERGMETNFGNAIKEVTGVSSDTKTKVVFGKGNVSVYIYNNGAITGYGKLMPDIVDVKVIEKENQPKVVVVYFADNTSEKAVLDANDTYSFEQGISICVTKKIIGRNTPYGTSIYNKVIARAMNVVKEKEVAILKAQEHMEKEAAKEQKIAAKKKKRDAERKYKAREEAISIQAEAYVRAMRQFQEENKVEVDKAFDELGEMLLNLATEAEKDDVSKAVEE